MTTHETATRYPLTWPAGWKRTPTAQRARARFRSGRTELSIYEATQRLQGELERLERGIGGVVLSTNVETRLDGMPRSDRRAPADPGAAVYFRLKGQPRCLACDKWDRVADNIAAIAAHIEAIRAVDRYGVGTLDQAFAGYAALPAPAMGWRDVFGFGADRPVTVDAVQGRYRVLARQYHPDVAGGSVEEMTRINAARDAALAELQAAG